MHNNKYDISNKLTIPCFFWDILDLNQVQLVYKDNDLFSNI